MLFKNCDLNSVFKNVRPNLCTLVSHILKLFFCDVCSTFHFPQSECSIFHINSWQQNRLGFVQLKLPITFEKNNNFISNFFPFRDVREYKSRVESYSREILRKEAQIKELQNRLENGEGSKSQNLFFCSTAKSTSSSSTLSF
jgi:hypothetical protein